MMNLAFVAAVAVGLLALLSWGVRTLPGERWQMLAAVPIDKSSRRVLARSEPHVLRLLQRDGNCVRFRHHVAAASFRRYPGEPSAKSFSHC